MKYMSKIMIILMVIGTLSSGIIRAAILGNGGNYVKGELRKLTTDASSSTLSAVSLLYDMLSRYEINEGNAQIFLKDFQRIFDLLKNSISKLNRAKSLNHSSFKKLDKKLESIDLSGNQILYNVTQRDEIRNEIFVSLQETKGKGWLNQTIVMNQHLLDAANKFHSEYSHYSDPILFQELLNSWNNELNRGRILSIILYDRPK